MQKMKLTLLSATTMLLVSPILFSYHQVEAAGTGWFGNVRITTSATSSNVGGSILFTIHAYDYRCTWLGAPAPNQPTSHMNNTPNCFEGYGNPTEESQVGQPGNVGVAGSGNTLSATSFVTDGAGNAQITLSSSVAETKTFNVYSGTSATNPPVGSTTVTFNSVSVAAPQPVAPRTTTSTPQQAAPPVEPAAPATPTVNVSISGKSVDAGQKPIFKNNQPIVLSGQTTPNGVVTIYVFSEPRKYTTTADKYGKWTYRVVGLPPGSHHIEAEVTDPATGKTSARAQILAFSVEKAVKRIVDTASARQASSLDKDSRGDMFVLAGMIAGGIALVLILTVAYLWKFKRDAFNDLLRILHFKRNNPKLL